MKVFLFLCLLFIFPPAVFTQTVDEFNEPRKNTNNALIIAAYHKNPINWTALSKEERPDAIIHKVSKGNDFTTPKYKPKE